MFSASLQSLFDLHQDAPLFRKLVYTTSTIQMTKPYFFESSGNVFDLPYGQMILQRSASDCIDPDKLLKFLLLLQDFQSDFLVYARSSANYKKSIDQQLPRLKIYPCYFPIKFFRMIMNQHSNTFFLLSKRGILNQNTVQTIEKSA